MDEHVGKAISPISVAFDDVDESQHLLVLLEAYNLYREKTTMRGDLWRQFPPSDKVRELRERVSRMETTQNSMYLVDRMEAGVRELRADAIDVINYAAFLIKQLDEGARG